MTPNLPNGMNDLLMLLLLMFISQGATPPGTSEQSAAAVEIPTEERSQAEQNAREGDTLIRLEVNLDPQRGLLIAGEPVALEAISERARNAGASTIRLQVPPQTSYQALIAVARALNEAGLALELQ